MIRQPPTSTPFPYTTLFQSPIAVTQRLPTFVPAPTRPILVPPPPDGGQGEATGGVRLLTARSSRADRKSTRLNSSHANIPYAVFCLKKTLLLESKKQGIR